MLPQHAFKRTLCFPAMPTVGLQVTTPDDLDAATVEVMMPGGLEALDPNVFQGDSGGLRV